MSAKRCKPLVNGLQQRFNVEGVVTPEPLIANDEGHPKEVIW
jgi:hypothetical protein